MEDEQVDLVDAELAAAVIDVTGIWLAHPWPNSRLSSSEVTIDGAHMTERLRLFLIIALGEVVLTTATAISQTPTTPSTVLAGVTAFAIVAALWALYFGGAPRIVDRDLAAATDVWAARMGANGQYVVLAGLVVTAVGCQTVIEEPHGAGSLTVGLLVGGGPLLYVATQSWYLHVTTHQKLTRRWIGCATLAVAIPIAIAVPPLVALGLVAVTLAALVAVAPRHRYAHRA